ncbi:MAG: hypothetical protein CMP91_03975 [Gammaproteobacteria bacterium]|nr:hypothetical protein [Gammaproteobacteria bacterium]MAY02552.1 hypothetical protein [Gammaproteobacteria bacterium]|tara:strand:- start:98329 stop:99738 length:1410 start_codon:yes stop_codon:yes gene_type:complete
MNTTAAVEPDQGLSQENLNPAQQVDIEYLGLDTQTIKDLEIFESSTGGQSLFDLCNYTRNKKGEAVLRRRMQHPWTDKTHIEQTQAAIAFIIAKRQAFNHLPSFVTTETVEDYFYGILPLTSDNVIEFSIGVLEMRFGDPRSYGRILRGVHITCELVNALQKIIKNPELESAQGELAPLVNEMKALLAHKKLLSLPDKETWNMNFWTVMRIDQIFRVYAKSAVHRLLQIIYEIDALVALADVTRKHGFNLPQVEDRPLFMQGEDLVHPFIKNPVPNPLKLDQEKRMLFLTGPNMAGKTTYMRACAVSYYFAHLGMGVPAKSFRFSPAQKLFSSISLSDNLNDGISFFRAEALRMKDIAQAIADGYRVIGLMDEPFKGTNIKDALDASQQILNRFAEKQDCLFIFSSHLIELSENIINSEQIDCRYFEAGEQEGELQFEYILAKGVSTQRLGMRVLEEEGVFKLLDKNRE